MSLTKEEERLKRVIEDFVEENFEITGCRECNETGNGEITPLENKLFVKGSYDKAIRELIETIRGKK